MPRETLPTNVKPINYTLSLDPDLENFTFSGHQTILMDVLQPSTTVTFNSKDLDVNFESIVSNFPGTPNVKCIKVTYDVEIQRISFHFDRPIGQTAEGSLDFDYTGVLGELKGFYRTKYTNSQGAEVYGAVTQFESTFARTAFVCADEPAAKATYEVTLVVPKQLTALSNMPEINTVDHPNNSSKKVVTYEKTPIMSTYLLAFFVGEVEYVERTISKKVSKNETTTVRVYTPPGQMEEAKFALDVACRVTTLYEEWFGMDYQLPKMDLIAISDFSSGAMENWGLITFRSKYLLYNPNTTSAKLKITQAVVVAHEIAHQWFGNLVTMDWWSGLWLNEGFATWMEWYMTDIMFPEWRVWEMFQIDSLNSALELDELDSSHAIQNSVDKATEVDEIFDSITYEKGAAVIVMLAGWLGNDGFRDGIRLYMNRYQYSNATTDQLWACLSESSGKDVSTMMSVWTGQVGYPLVEVLTNDNGKSLTVRQQRYHSVKPIDGSGGIDPVWPVPLNILLSDGTVLRTEFNTREAIIDIDTGGRPGVTWIKINAGRTGFYRTLYRSRTALNNLCKAIKNKKVGAIDRMEVIDNMFAFASSGYSDLGSTLEFLCNCYLTGDTQDPNKREDDYIVWSAIIEGVYKVQTVWYQHPEVKKKFGQLLVPAIKPLYEDLKWDLRDGDSYQDIQMRILAITTLGRYQDPDVLAEAQVRFNGWVDDPKNSQSLHPDLQFPVMCMVVRRSQENFAKLLAAYDRVESNITQGLIIRALACTDNWEDLTRVLDFSYTSGKVRNQDAWYPSVSAGSGIHREGHWNYVTDKWDSILKVLDGAPRLIGYMLQQSIEHLYDQQLYNRVVQFLESKKEDLKENQMTITQALEVTQKGIKWLERDGSQVLAWARSNPSNPSKAAWST